MNRKDCEKIAYLIHNALGHESPQWLIDGLLSLDPRIVDEHEAWQVLRDKDEAVHELTECKMTEKFGPDYGCLRAATVDEYRAAREAAEREIMGDDDRGVKP